MTRDFSPAQLVALFQQRVALNAADKTDESGRTWHDDVAAERLTETALAPVRKAFETYLAARYGAKSNKMKGVWRRSSAAEAKAGHRDARAGAEAGCRRRAWRVGRSGSGRRRRSRGWCRSRPWARRPRRRGRRRWCRRGADSDETGLGREREELTPPSRGRHSGSRDPCSREMRGAARRPPSSTACGARRRSRMCSASRDAGPASSCWPDRAGLAKRPSRFCTMTECDGTSAGSGSPLSSRAEVPSQRAAPGCVHTLHTQPVRCLRGVRRVCRRSRRATRMGLRTFRATARAWGPIPVPRTMPPPGATSGATSVDAAPHDAAGDGDAAGESDAADSSACVSSTPPSPSGGTTTHVPATRRRPKRRRVDRVRPP